MTRLLVVHHTTSPVLQDLLEEVLRGARTPEVSGVEVIVRAALRATVADVLAADGYLLGTPATIGYISGALKHFFDQIYYPCLSDTARRPFGAWVHGGSDTSGALRALSSITTGLSWAPVGPPLSLVGPVGAAEREACWNLGATVAATLAG